jgi:hypothetical protein
MSVDTKHPDWSDRKDEWAMLRHAVRGETAVKSENETYLPMPSGFLAQPDRGVAMYGSYKTRAQFPDILGPTLRGMVGVIHRTEAEIELPAVLEPIWEKATADGLTLEAFHRRITGELLLMGRYGVLVDMLPDGGEVPYFAGYTAEALINWDDARSLYVLDESGKVRREFEWVDERKFRVLDMDEAGAYRVRVFGDTLVEVEAVEPKMRGGGRFVEIPFVTAGPRDLSVRPDESPLIGVARASMAMYRLDADYRHQLFMSGQETLFCIGVDQDSLPTVTGAGVVIGLPENGDAKYVGPAGVGIDAHRQAILDERDAAIAAGARIFDSETSGQESGEALRLRYAAQTATLTTVSQASAAVLEKALRYAAMFVGANPDEVVVKPNLRFMDQAMKPDDAVKLVSVWQSGAISKLTLYENLQRGEIASPERNFDDEEELIEVEPIDEPAQAEEGQTEAA